MPQSKLTSKKSPKDNTASVNQTAAKKPVGAKTKDVSAGLGVIISPLISEAAMMQSHNNIYVFKVEPRANKIMVKQAVEKMYNVKVASVRTSLAARKSHRRARGRAGKSTVFKKAYVKIRGDKKIDILKI